MNRQHFLDLLRSSLEIFWTEVNQLSVEDTKTLLNEFTLACVREDFRDKFVQELNSSRPITARFFRQPVECDLATGLEAILGFRPTSLQARAAWGGFDDPVGFQVCGTTKAASDLFVEERDAIAFLSAERRFAWLFLAGASGAMWTLSSGRGQT